MDPFLQNILWLAGFGVGGLAIGYLLGKVGLTNIKTEIALIKTDILGLKLQSPLTVTHVSAPTPSAPVTIPAHVS